MILLHTGRVSVCACDFFCPTRYQLSTISSSIVSCRLACCLLLSISLSAAPRLANVHLAIFFWPQTSSEWRTTTIVIQKGEMWLSFFFFALVLLYWFVVLFGAVKLHSDRYGHVQQYIFVCESIKSIAHFTYIRKLSTTSITAVARITNYLDGRVTSRLLSALSDRQAGRHLTQKTSTGTNGCARNKNSLKNNGLYGVKSWGVYRRRAGQHKLMFAEAVVVLTATSIKIW